VTPGKVGRLSRLIDLASLILILAGGALYLKAYFGMQELRSRPEAEFIRGESVAFGRIAEHARLTRVSRVGLAIAGLGLIVGLSAAAHARQIARRRSMAQA
jgi:hypothetical protein